MKFANGTKSTISCLNCGPVVVLVVRTNKQNQSQFLACPNWPECRHTQEIPESWHMRAAGQQELFTIVE